MLQLLYLHSPCRLGPVPVRLYLPVSQAVDPIDPCWPFLGLFSFTCWTPACHPSLSGCAELWRSLCGTWWCCWHVCSPLDAATVRGSAWPAVCSCSSSSCRKLSTPWWVCMCVTASCGDKHLNAVLIELHHHLAQGFFGFCLSSLFW